MKKKHCLSKNKGTIGFFILGVSSLFWLIFRSGKKPSRLQYPCQKIAASNSVIFISWLISVLGGHFLYRRIRKHLTWERAILVGALALLVFSGAKFFQLERLKKARAQTMGTPRGYKPGRVAWVYDENATTGIYGDYWNQVDQTVVNEMLDKAVKALTDETTVGGALSRILPCGSNCTGKKIAVKVNFNNTGRARSTMDANYQPIKAFIRQLVTAESDFSPFNQADIYVYDVSRPMGASNRAYFVANIIADYPGVHLVGETDGDGAGPAEQYVDSGEDFSFNSSYCSPSGSHNVAQLLKDVDYLVNMPLLKGYGSSIGATLSFKNHLGTTNNPYGLHPCLTPSGNNNGLVAVYTARFHNNDGGWTSLADKVVLTIGDALYGHKRSNVQAPHNWRMFNNDSPNSFFVSQDVVAVDSIMYDVITQESGRGDMEDGQLYLHAAAAHSPSLGVHEHWHFKTGCSDGDDLSCWDYDVIDFVKCDPDCPGVSPSPSPSPSFSPSPNPSPSPSPAEQILTILANWGSDDVESDKNGDGKVNGMDFGHLIKDWSFD